VILVGWGVILPVAGVFVDGIVFWLVFLFLFSGGDGVFLEKSVCVQAGCLTCLLLVQSSSSPPRLVYLFPKCIIRFRIYKGVQTGINSFFVPLLYRQ
jgi:hypothetical protein